MYVFIYLVIHYKLINVCIYLFSYSFRKLLVDKLVNMHRPVRLSMLSKIAIFLS